MNTELTNQGATADGSSPIKVTFTKSKRQYIIESNGTITLLADGVLTDLQKLREYFIGKNYEVWWDVDTDNYKMLDGLQILDADEETYNTYSGNGDLILFNNNYYELIYANNGYDDVVENVVEYEKPPYANNWIIAWAYNGSYWSNPYTRDNSLLSSYFNNMDSNYSISDVSELNDANILALLYENENDSSTYKLIIYGTGKIVDSGSSVGAHPWTGSYYEIGTIGDYISMDWNFSSNFGNKITRLEIQEGITEIGDDCFECLNISYVYIANSVETIGDMTFKDTTSLTQVEFGNEFNGIFTDSNSDGAYDSFMGSNWLNVYAQAHPESESTEYPEGFVTIPINGVSWKFLWWVD